jgi:hypothetical protein
LCKENASTITSYEVIPSTLWEDSGEDRRTRAKLLLRDYSICSLCESRLKQLDNYVGYQLKEDTGFKVFEVAEREGRVTFQHLNPHAFMCYVYSLIWRCTLSDNPAFKSLKCDTPTYIVEQIRQVLYNSLVAERNAFYKTRYYSAPFKFGFLRCLPDDTHPVSTIAVTVSGGILGFNLSLFANFVYFFIEMAPSNDQIELISNDGLSPITMSTMPLDKWNRIVSSIKGPSAP